MFRKILVGLDGSEAAGHALRLALELARLGHAREVRVLSVHERLRAYAGTVSEIESEAAHQTAYFAELQGSAKEMANTMGVQLETEILAGHPAELLARRAQEDDFDLIVIGHTGHSRLHHLFLGSTADRVVERAGCSVLVVR
jgi:nucleotide-binding universal stress UspA family protein